jgi:hypothetical protein
MKLILFITSIALFVSGCSSSGNPPLEKEYSKIEKRADETNRLLSTFTGINSTLDDGSEMISYYHSGTLKKIHIAKDRTGGIETRDCYFHNWKISYIVDSVTDLDMGSDNRTSRDRYYFKDDKLIGWDRHDADVISTSGSGYKEKEKELLDDVEAYLLVIQ